MRAYGHRVDVGDVLECLLERRNHAEYSDAAGKCGVVGVYLVGAGRDPVASGGRHGTVRYYQGLFLLEQLQFSTDDLGGLYGSSWRIDPEYYGLDGAVAADVPDDGLELLGRDAVPFDIDLSVSIDDGDFVLDLIVCLEAGLGVFVQGNHLDILDLLCSGEHSELVFHLVYRVDAVDETGIEHVLCRVQLQIVDHPVQCVRRDAS